MKRLLFVVSALLICLAMVLPVSAASQAEQLRTEAVVSRDGSCRAVITASVIYEEAVASPVFPVPAGAENITLNGSPATVYMAASSRMVSLKDVTRGKPGSYSFSVSYSLPAVVESTGNGMDLSLELLSGFPYPVKDLHVLVQLPGDVTGTPVFSSGYHQQSVRDLLEVTVDGRNVTAVSTEVLKDHETLSLTMSVDPKLFPKTATTARMLSIMDLVVAASLLLAVAFYVITMRPKIPWRASRPAAPDGITAGEVTLWLTGGHLDLSMLVVTWAQLGYIRIQVEPSGRVLLHKRMDMGNERSPFENRCYKELFGRRRLIDGTGTHYAKLCRSVMYKSPQIKEVYRPESGHPLVFRGLCVLSALLNGFNMAGVLVPHSVFWMAVLTGVVGVFALLLQSGGRSLMLRSRRPAWVALGCAVAWLVLGIVSGAWLGALAMAAFQFLSGMALGYGGRRTELGQQAFSQLLGLRRFMGRVSKRELQMLLKANPGYFHELAPYALALGVDKTFARRFGRLRLPECTYLIAGQQRQMTATEWAQMLRATVDALERRARWLPIERSLGKVR